jgi:hypothetical protein
MKYVRYDAPPEIRLRYHFRDKFGNDILRSLDYDPATGIGHTYVRERADGTKEGTIEYFRPGGYVEVDGHINPSPETLQALFANSKAVLTKEVMDATVKKIEQEVHYREGQAALSS